MIVQYLGGACFRAQSGDVSVLVNPASNRLKADVTLRTLVPANVLPPPDEIIFPGEYEIRDIGIRGFPIPTESTEQYLKTVYLVAWEDIRLLFLGHFSGRLGDDVLEEVAKPDIAFFPVGEHFVPPAAAAKFLRKLEPAVVIPSFFSVKGGNGPAEFLRALGAKGERMEKFVFRKKDLAGSKGKVVVLEEKS